MTDFMLENIFLKEANPMLERTIWLFVDACIAMLTMTCIERVLELLYFFLPFLQNVTGLDVHQKHVKDGGCSMH